MELFADREEFKKWAEVFRKVGVKTVKIADIQIEFINEALLPESEYKKKLREKELEKTKIDPVVQADRELFWSTNVEAQG